MWLCAGITSISFKYSNCLITKVIVTKLKQRSKSAGNFADFTHESTSETLRDNYEISSLSIHVPTHLKPINNNESGHYLAGLIDCDGYFSNTPQLVIAFNELDASLAYYIKGKIGYGNIYKVKNKKAIILVIASQAGIIKVLQLIKDKIRSQKKIDQINNNILSHAYFNEWVKFSLNNEINLNNHWLAGFSDADASFQIKIINRNNRTEVRLAFQIDQKNKELLILIQQYLGGNIGYRKSQDT